MAQQPKLERRIDTMARSKISPIKKNLPTSNDSHRFEFDIAIVGGLGHVGLPLGIAFADKGLRVLLCDLDPKKAEMVKRGEMPFIEWDADPILKRVVGKTLHVSLNNADISKAQYVVLAIGTPVDEFLNPKLRAFLDTLKDLKKYLSLDQTIIIRSTVYPNTCRQVAKVLGSPKEPWKIAYCPERIAQGYAVRELAELPQVVAGIDDEAADSARQLFGRISPKLLSATLEEAELVKLYCNAWRYIQFAASNQFFMMSQNFGVDFLRVRQLMTEGYGRAASLPGAGFAAGPCLLKDTMQLAAFDNNRFNLGYSAMMVNEGLPNYLVENLKRKYVLNLSKVGILGMAFKAEVDDIRDSLSYKLGKILRFNGADVYYSDEYAKDPTFVSKETIVEKCNIVIIGAPHQAYRSLQFSPYTEVVDVWGILQNRKLPVEGPTVKTL